jgi:hypothetical protein
MNSLVIEHVLVNELPEDWRLRLQALPNARVTVRIEEEETRQPEAQAPEVDPAFGIWRDRTDLNDVDAYVRELRGPRYRDDGSRNGE